LGGGYYNTNKKPTEKKKTKKSDKKGAMSQGIDEKMKMEKL